MAQSVGGGVAQPEGGGMAQPEGGGVAQPEGGKGCGLAPQSGASA